MISLCDGERVASHQDTQRASERALQIPSHVCWVYWVGTESIRRQHVDRESIRCIAGIRRVHRDAAYMLVLGYNTQSMYVAGISNLNALGTAFGLQYSPSLTIYCIHKITTLFAPVPSHRSYKGETKIFVSIYHFRSFRAGRIELNWIELDLKFCDFELNWIEISKIGFELNWIENFEIFQFNSNIANHW